MATTEIQKNISVAKLAKVINRQCRLSVDQWKIMDTLVRELDAEMNADGEFIDLCGFER